MTQIQRMLLEEAYNMLKDTDAYDIDIVFKLNTIQDKLSAILSDIDAQKRSEELVTTVRGIAGF